MKTLFDALKINRDEFRYFYDCVQKNKELRKMENYIVINGKKIELTEEQLKALGIKLSRGWRARDGEKYFYANSYHVVTSTEECGRIMDDKNYYNHNYFQTNSEAVTYARVLETEMLIKKFADEHNDPPFNSDLKFALSFKGEVCVNAYPTLHCRPRTVWFTNRQIALQAIEEIGSERIEEYLTYEW